MAPAIEILLPPAVETIQADLDEFVKHNPAAFIESKDRAEFQKDCAEGGRYANVKVIYASPVVFGKVGPFDAEMFEKILPAGLKAVCYNGAGYDKINVHAALERKIQVSHTPSAVDDATATTAMYLIISALRGFSKAEAQARRGDWDKGLPLQLDPEGKTLGIIGLGGIGRSLARRALGFDMKVVYHNRNPVDESILKEERLTGQIEYISNMDELIKTVDVISLNLPLNEKTKGFFNADKFALMKPNAIIVNTARGGVIDEEAMIEALDSGKLRSAGLDVFAQEPTIPEALRKNEKIAILPHLGTATSDTRRKMEMLVLNNVKQFLSQGTLITPVPEHKGKF